MNISQGIHYNKQAISLQNSFTIREPNENNIIFHVYTTDT